MKKIAAIISIFFAFSLVLGACSAKTPESAAPAAENLELNILAAASLKNVMTELTALYSTLAPNVKLTFSFAASGTLQTQIEQGIACDVFISAAQKQMNALDTQGLLLAGTKTELLENKIVLIIPKDSSSPASFQELATMKGQLAIGDPASVPAGQYGEEALKSLNIFEQVKGKRILGKDVTEVLSWVATGNAESGIVYATDALSNPNVKIMANAPDGSYARAIYPVAVTRDSKHPEAAKAFIGFLKTADAKKAFTNFGFSSL